MANLYCYIPIDVISYKQATLIFFSCCFTLKLFDDIIICSREEYRYLLFTSIYYLL